MAVSAHDQDAARARIASLYDPEAFQAAGKVWLDALVQHFQRLQQGDAKVLNWRDPEVNITAAFDLVSAAPRDRWRQSDWLPDFLDRLETILNRSQNLHHPCYIGHQVPASVPLAALFDAVGSATNQVMAIYEMGPWATAVERAIVRLLGAEIGYPPNAFAGFVTSGGSLANLTALLTARNVAMQGVWESGVRDARQAALIVQQDVHYCIVRAAGVLGIGTEQVHRVPVDGQRKMRVEELERIICEQQAAGRQIIAVVAGACATPTGAFDPIEDIAAVCQQHRVWLHVDAAHGGAALLSERHRHRLRGLQLADSIVWDAHKMLFMPALCALVFYKRREHRFAAFQQDAPYLFDPADPGMAEFDSGTQTLECTKRAAAFGLWGMWSLFGRQLFQDLVDVTFALTQQFHEMLESDPEFEPCHRPESNIQVFRYVPACAKQWSIQELGEFQLRLRQQCVRSGAAYLVPIKIDGAGALRATLINPTTTADHLGKILDTLRGIGKELVGKPQ